MNTGLTLLTLALLTLDVSFSLYASSYMPPVNLDESNEEEADDLPFGPTPSDQD
ncbi:hypothetical protein SAMN06269250_6252 [Spirosoma fluviale]|uniref:Uncharacterized protein n=1 Tax=Spirosoma fluviale TaxID=1597977 RepID=A0A286GTZ3_9BACT|nr:hypothetical protein SAMN06269250_6252 [Spirosoma fluviale]